MKIAFTGKGGVGKTTLAAALIYRLAKSGNKVLAVDCDPDSNLAGLLGFEDASKIKPISKMKDLINDRMEIRDKKSPFYKLNPKIDDLPAAYAKRKGNISLLVMGTVEKAGAGCVCPESVFMRNLLNRIMLNEGEHIVLDMEAGIEHFGRSTAEACDRFVVVVEPSSRSVETAVKIEGLAKGLKVKNVYAIANKVKSEEDARFITKGLGGIRVIASVPYSEKILALDKRGSIGQLDEGAIDKAVEELIALK